MVTNPWSLTSQYLYLGVESRSKCSFRVLRDNRPQIAYADLASKWPIHSLQLQMQIDYNILVLKLVNIISEILKHLIFWILSSLSICDYLNLIHPFHEHYIITKLYCSQLFLPWGSQSLLLHLFLWQCIWYSIINWVVLDSGSWSEHVRISKSKCTCCRNIEYYISFNQMSIPLSYHNSITQPSRMSRLKKIPHEGLLNNKPSSARSTINIPADECLCFLHQRTTSNSPI